MFLDFPLNLQLLTPCASTATTLVASAVAMAMAKAGVALTGGTQLAEADTGPIDFVSGIPWTQKKSFDLLKQEETPQTL